MKWVWGIYIYTAWSLLPAPVSKAVLRPRMSERAAIWLPAFFIHIHHQPSGVSGNGCMAKKSKKYSHVLATEELEKLGIQGVSAHDFVYELLRIFAEYGDGQIGRLKDGRGNLAKDDVTVLVKNLIAYRPEHKHDSETLYD
ncbi:MAG: hypothetical protein K2G77_06955, partial [Muribaculaceae bacterium]|nr:hypothetical protein [Muribaculaceae bacterium]